MNEETGPKIIRVTQENLEVLQALAGDAYETAIPSILRALATEAGIPTEGASRCSSSANYQKKCTRNSHSRRSH